MNCSVLAAISLQKEMRLQIIYEILLKNYDKKVIFISKNDGLFIVKFLSRSLLHL
jgi:hypothetical protein